MRVRDVYLAKNDTQSDSGTKAYNLAGLGAVQHLRVKYRATNGATSNTVGKLNGMVSKIEVVDGSDLHESLSMQEWQAYNAFENGQFPFKILDAGAAAVVQEEAIVQFGRYFGDVVYWYDTNKYKNPQLRLTHALTISATAGFATGTCGVDVIARVIEGGGPGYKGFVSRKEQRSISTAASGDDQAILAIDYPYFSLLIQAKKTTILPDAIISNFKLLVDNGRIILWDKNATDLLAENINDYQRFEEEFRPLSDTAATFLSDLYYKTGAVFDIAGATGLGKISSVTAESIVAAMTTGQAAGTMRMQIRGYSPHSCFFLPFGELTYGPDVTYVLFDPVKEGVKELKLLSTQGTSAATLNVCSAQLRV